MMSAGLAFETAGAARAGAGLVGPNAVIQLAEALRPIPGVAERIFARAGFSRFLRQPPDAMIDETIPARLFEALWRDMPPEEAARIAHEAGLRTGAYVLANRIPGFARALLRALPRRPASALLLKAIHKNAWTFAGSGICLVETGDPVFVTILGNPIVMPGGVWHIGVFEALFRALVTRKVRVRHEASLIDGRPACRFRIDLSA
jgi:divinyl protochlorophyllide a 8-vinyl-reductase